MSDPCRVLTIDDSAVFRAGLRALISATPGLELVGEASDGLTGLAMVSSCHPDVALMDLTMPEMNGIEATRQIVASAPHVGVLVITMFDDDDSVFAAMQAGARGYLLKGASRAEVVRSIQAVADGEAIFSPAIARRLQHYFSSRPRSETQSPIAFPDLSAREREVLGLIAQHLTNPEIAALLDLNEKTVRNYVSNIFAKLQVNNRSRAIMLARDAGFGHHS